MSKKEMVRSFAGFFGLMARSGATIYLTDDQYARATRCAGNDPSIIESPLGRTLQPRRLGGSREHLNLSFFADKEVTAQTDRGGVPVTVPRAYNIVRRGERLFDEVLAVVPDEAAFQAFVDAGCLPKGAVYHATRAYTFKTDHLPMVSDDWRDPERLVAFLRAEADLMAERNALNVRASRLASERGITLPRVKSKTLRVEGRKRYKEALDALEAVPSVEAQPRLIYELIGYEPKVPVGIPRYSADRVARRLEEIGTALIGVRMRLALAKLAFELNGGIAWSDPQPIKRSQATEQKATVAGVELRCLRDPVPAAA